MKIKKEKADSKLFKKLSKENKKVSIEDLAAKYGVSRNVMGEFLRTRMATPETVSKIKEKELELTEA